MKNHESIELQLRRSGIMRDNVRLSHVESVCREISRHVTRMKRLRLELCNGVPKQWDSVRKEWIMGLDESDTARIESQWSESRNRIETVTRGIMRRGILFNFKRDPRAGVLFRVYNKANTKDAWI